MAPVFSFYDFDICVWAVRGSVTAGLPTEELTMTVAELGTFTGLGKEIKIILSSIRIALFKLEFINSKVDNA
ncbi:hypothetical protein [Calothrix sp. PCC 6303]|uniref:hypothetical protein n=1 Tax=Calothrix sp. PCC 6303 TaxID=1170562 RepID=UPI0005A1EF3B|nr:hypothetical protein [Calothrix sp. PCC 6303]